MTSVQPPNVIIFPTINFNSLFYNTTSSQYLTQSGALSSFLAYPIAQGTETLQDINVNGDATFLNDINVGNTNCIINKDISDNLNLTASVGNVNIIGIGGNTLSVGNSTISLNGVPLSLDISGQYLIQLSGTSMNFTNAVNSAFTSFVNYTNTGTQSIPILFNYSTTTISNATTINNLTSTTQPVNTNNTKVATTAFVQNQISALPSSAIIIPYLYGFSPNQIIGASNFISINFTNGASLNSNTYFTLRCQIQYTWNTTGGISALNPYFLNYEFLMDIYPNRVPTINAGNNNSLPNGTLNGNANYVITPNDPIYSPNGRWYWIRNYSSSTASPTSPTAITNPFYFLTLSQSRVTFILNSPDFSNTGYYNIEASIEIINRSSGTTFTSGGINGFTSFYNSF